MLANQEAISGVCAVYSQLDGFFDGRENLLIATPRLARNVSVCSVGERHPTLHTGTFLASRVGRQASCPTDRLGGDLCFGVGGRYLSPCTSHVRVCLLDSPC